MFIHRVSLRETMHLLTILCFSHSPLKYCRWNIDSNMSILSLHVVASEHWNVLVTTSFRLLSCVLLCSATNSTGNAFWAALRLVARGWLFIPLVFVLCLFQEHFFLPLAVSLTWESSRAVTSPEALSVSHAFTSSGIRLFYSVTVWPRTSLPLSSSVFPFVKWVW